MIWRCILKKFEYQMGVSSPKETALDTFTILVEVMKLSGFTYLIELTAREVSLINITLSRPRRFLLSPQYVYIEQDPLSEQESRTSWIVRFRECSPEFADEIRRKVQAVTDTTVDLFVGGRI